MQCLRQRLRSTWELYCCALDPKQCVSSRGAPLVCLFLPDSPATFYTLIGKSSVGQTEIKWVYRSAATVAICIDPPRLVLWGRYCGGITVSYYLAFLSGSNAISIENHKCLLTTLLLHSKQCAQFQSQTKTLKKHRPPKLIDFRPFWSSVPCTPIPWPTASPRLNCVVSGCCDFEQFLIRFDLLKLQFWTVLEGPSVVAEGTRPLASQHQLHPHHMGNYRNSSLQLKQPRMQHASPPCEASKHGSASAGLEPLTGFLLIPWSSPWISESIVARSSRTIKRGSATRSGPIKCGRTWGAAVCAKPECHGQGWHRGELSGWHHTEWLRSLPLHREDWNMLESL